MTDAQIIAIAVTVLAVLAGTLFNNVRIGDINSSLNRRIDDMRDVLRSELKAQSTEMSASLARVEAKIEAVLKLLADVDQRVTRLEERPH